MSETSPLEGSVLGLMHTALSIKPLEKRHVADGGAEGVRTPDLLNAIQALYQLSYDPIRSGGKCKTPPEFVKTILNF